jgi:hypothetical protein
MKRVQKMLVIALVAASVASMAGCTSGVAVGEQERVATVGSYGLADKEDKIEGADYTLSVKNAVIALIGAETFIIPIAWFATAFMLLLLASRSRMEVPVERGGSYAAACREDII